MAFTSVSLALCGVLLTVPTAQPPADVPPETGPLPQVEWLPNQRVEYRQAMRVAFLEACGQICPAGDKACVERCALRPLAEIAADRGDDEELLACDAEGGAWVAQIPACAAALSRLMLVSNPQEQPQNDATADLESRREQGLHQLEAILEAATGVGRFCSPEGLCHIQPPQAASDVSNSSTEKAR